MLIQHKFKMSLKPSLVNETLMGVILMVAAIASPAAASAFSYGDSITTSVHKVKFDRTALKTPEGVAAVYAKLEKKAKRACAMGSNVDSEGGLISKEDCVQNLLAQFVDSPDLKTLKQYHLMKDASAKSASLLPR